MFVRTAGEPDLERIRALLVETWHATYDPIYGPERVAGIVADWHSLVALKARLSKPRSEFLVADDGATLAGMAFAEQFDRIVLLRQLYVLPAFQRQGVGKMLLDEVTGCFPEADTMRLEVEEANVRALAFYERQGFARVGHTPNCGAEGSGIPALIYERPILSL